MNAPVPLDLFAPEVVIPAVDVTGELPHGFNQGDDIDAKLAAHKALIKQYLADGWACAISWSSGKDSSVQLALTLDAVRDFVAECGRDACPDVVVLHSDTLVDNPLVASHSRSEVEKIKAFCEKHDLPVLVEIAKPNYSEDYLVNIIGGRTIMTVAETTNRKCAVMLKVNPIQRLKKKIMKRLKRQYGSKVLTLIGKRFDESAVRKADMIANGEVPNKHVERNGDKILSSIAHFTLDNVYWLVGLVRSEMFDTYSDFTSLVEVYRAANGGECMVNAVEGKTGGSGCGARTGCFVCGAVTGRDGSMDSMLEDEKNQFMRYLAAFRSCLLAYHNDPSKRTWLARSVNKDGTIKIQPNSYSPEFTEDLLRMALSIQVMEEEEAFRLGIAPRFTVLSFEQVMAIQCQWGRYSYHRGLEALRIWKEVYDQGKLLLPPLDESELPSFPTLNKLPEVSVPFADEHYHSPTFGFRSVEDMIADCEWTVEKASGTYTDALTADEFTINTDELYFFQEYELDYALSKYNDDHYAPGASLHYLVRIGLVSINKGSHSEYDRMLRMGNQIWRSDLRSILNDPVAIIEKLGGDASGFRERGLF